MPLIFNTLAVFFTLVTAGAYWYGLQESFFWIYSWYDIMLHLMGGLVMGFWASAVSARLGLRPAKAFLLIIGIAIVGGVVWEVFEYLITYEQKVGYVIDTTADILNGLIGGVATALIYSLVYKPKTHVE